MVPLARWPIYILLDIPGGHNPGGSMVICRSKKATEKTDMRQNENLHLKTRIKCIVLLFYS